MRALLVAALFCCLNSAAVADPSNTLDQFVSRITQAFAKGPPYSGFKAAVDPGDRMTSGIEAILSILASETDDQPISFIEMFRIQSRPNGAVITGALVPEEGDSGFIAFVLLRKPEGWGVVNVSMQGQYEKLLKYH